MAGPTREGRDPDFDAEWNDITARLGDLQIPPETSPDSAESARSGEPVAAQSPPEPGPRDFSVLDEEDEPYEPEELPDLTAGHPVTTLGWVLLVGGLALLVVTALLWRGAPPIVWLAAVASGIAGATCLIWQLPSGRSDDGDDGAVV